jgi:serine protease Do/serine protease DegQ
MAANVMKSLIETGTVTRGFLGVLADPLTPDVAEQVGLPRDTKGVIVTKTGPDSPAERAGIKRRDVILSMNGKPVESHDELRLMISQMSPGTKVALEISRDGKPVSLDVTLAEVADRPNELLEGVEVAKLTDDLRQHLGLDARTTGLVVTEVSEKSNYSQDLPVGAVIIEINRNPVSDVEGAKALIHPGHNLLLVAYRGLQRWLVVTKR